MGAVKFQIQKAYVTYQHGKQITFQWYITEAGSNA